MKPFNSAFCFLFLCGAFAFSQDDRLVVKKDPTDPKRLICELKHATFKVPEGWQPNRSDGKTQCILTKSTDKPASPSQMIMIDVGKPSDPNPKDLAKSFAKMWGGEVLEKTLKVDGEEAFKISIPPTEKKVQPTNAIVVIKDARVFMLIGGAKSDEKLDKVLEQLAADWRWK
jgi:hypothetical protein